MDVLAPTAGLPLGAVGLESGVDVVLAGVELPLGEGGGGGGVDVLAHGRRGIHVPGLQNMAEEPSE